MGHSLIIQNSIGSISSLLLDTILISIRAIRFFFSVFPICHSIVLQSNHTKLDKTPRIGEQITIIPTHVVNAKEFYGQLGAYFNALQYSQQCLNYRRLYAQNEPYSQLPGTLY